MGEAKRDQDTAARIEEAWMYPLEPAKGRCAYCGGICRGYTCQYHKDLPRLDWRGEKR